MTSFPLRARSQPLSRPQARETGAMLIIALGVLTLLAILGAAFASLIRLEKRATDNYIESRKMDSLLETALDRVIAELQGAKSFRHYTFYKDTPWLYLLKDRSGQGDLAHGRADIEDPRVGQWVTFAEQAGNKLEYKTKVIDPQSQINLNGRQDTLARMLDNLGEAIESSERLKQEGKRVTNPFYTKPYQSGNQVKGKDILLTRQLLPGGKFTSKNQLKQLIGPENFAIVEDFVTVSSWEDPSTYAPGDGLDQVPKLTLGAAAAVGGGASQVTQPPAYGNARLVPEPRHPINLNTAPEEVLIACLMGVAGRRIIPFSKFSQGGGLQEVDPSAMITGQRHFNLKEEYREVTPRGVFVYSPRLEKSHAKQIADQIIARRKQTPFMAWRTYDPSKPGFEDFIDLLDQNFFPAAQTCKVIDPDQPRNTAAQVALFSGDPLNPMSRMWIKAHGQGAVRATRQRLGLAYHETNAWYYDLIKGVIKSNANPNTRINRYNPNAPSYIPVDKSDLVWAEVQTLLWKGYTTEFCFDSNGIFEVTTLGRIVDGKDKGANTDPFALDAFERKTRTVVKIYDVLRHTSQLDFEKTFASGTRTSRSDRRYVVTYPDPMAALTELITAGAKRDGRVELAGLLDGVRLEAPIATRPQMAAGGTGSISYAQTFQERDSASIAKLKRLTTSGNNPSVAERATILSEVFDATFARETKAKKQVRRQELVEIQAYKNNQQAYPSDPEVKTEVEGGDLFPDGLHSSILRTSHLQGRMLVVPARQRIGDPSASGGNMQVGASGLSTRGTNVMGNVPYYRGGIAFWVKFDFNGDDPVFCGLVACTQVIREVSPNPSDYKGSEGTQFFIFKNSEGRLRVVRMYYHQAFPDQGGGYGGGEGNVPQLHPVVPVAEEGNTGEQGRNPIKDELDPKKIVSRADSVPLDISHFRAHEWHHIAVDWNDDDIINSVRVFIDFQEVRDAPPVKPQDPESLSEPSSWVRLNEVQPKDGLWIGGFVRDQGMAEAGLFKWFTNTTTGATAGGGASGFVQRVAESVKKVLANATIDELIVYSESSFSSVKQYYGGRSSPGYFSQQNGEYANVFEIPLPPDVDHVVLRSFDWTSYYPTLYTDSLPNSLPVQLQTTPITCELSFSTKGVASPPANFPEPWRNPSVVNPVAGRPAFRNDADIYTKGNKAELVYKFTMIGGRSQVGNTSGGVVQTPAIDDVTLTYFLPNPKILLQEGLD